MGIMFLTVIGFAVTIGAVIAFLMYYLVDTFDSNEYTKRKQIDGGQLCHF